MAIVVTPAPQWEQRREVSGGNTAACNISWSAWAPLNSSGSSLSNGEEFIRDPVTHKGNHVDALPYFCAKTELESPSWDFRTVYHAGPFQCPRNENRGNGGTLSAVSAGDVVPSSSNMPSQDDMLFCDRMALLKAKAALRRADASIPMMFRERIATLNMLKSYSGRSLDLIRRRQLADVERFKRLTRRSTREGRKFLAQTIANEHLMFVFGMLPLIGEMEGLASFVTRDTHQHITGRGRMTRVRESTTGVVSPTVVNRGLSTRTKKTGRYSARCSLHADISLQLLADMQRLGFNPLYTLYDFTPLSFVSGWFSNFNYWLQSLDPLVGSIYRTGSLTTRRELTCEREVYFLPVSGPGTRVDASGHGRGRGKFWYQERKIVPSEPDSGSPEFYNNLSFFSVTAGISLYIQRKVKLANTAIAQRPFRYRSSRPVTLPPITYRR